MRFFLMFGLLCGLALAQPRWQPGQSYLLVASITSWPAAAQLASFPSTRRDGDLVRAFEQAGVPRSHIIFLKDSQAKRPAILAKLRELAQLCQPQDTLFFYFQGHGQPGLFCTYDYESKRPEQTALRTQELYPLLQDWKGGQLFLIGDCCSSGSLQTVVRQFEQNRPKVRVAGLASATASNQSTGNWTFTEGLLRILGGDPLVDRNRDGQISLSEGRAFLHDQMKYKEDQLCSLTLSGSFEPDFVWRAATPAPLPLPGPYQRGEIVLARDQKNEWYRSEILDHKDGRYRVHYNGWDNKWDEWVAPAEIKRLETKTLDLNGAYEVEREKKWLPAVLTDQVENYFYFAHYLHEAGEADEWITADRARPASPQKEAFKPARSGAEAAMWVAAQWHGHWYRGRITGRSDGLFEVRYDDDTSGRLSLPELIPILPAKPGERVLGVRESDGRMFPGRWNGTLVEWEDGKPPSAVAPEKLAPIR